MRLLFLPGAGADPGFWKPVGDRLPLEWEKVYFDWPGLGHRPPDAGVRDFNNLVSRVEAEIGGHPVDLLAQSMGGAIALQVALRNPSLVRRLVLSVTSGGLDVAALGGVDWRPAYLAEYPHANLSILEGCPDMEDELCRIAQPALLLWGDADPISPVAVGERLHRLLPASRLEIVRGGDHALVQDRADETARLILRHLS
ncbi:MAG: alpha/beta fold hydrolase [Asticcacaulis sp.]